MEDKPLIRTATAADLPAVHALVERAYRGDAARRGWTHEADLLEGQRIDVPALANMLASEALCILVAEVGGRLSGCVQVADCGDGIAYLGMLSVEPDLQAGGLGRRLIAAAEETAERLFGASRMEMTVIRQRAELIAYYERRGYRVSGEERPFPYDDPRFGLPRRHDLSFVVMSKPLGG